MPIERHFGEFQILLFFFKQVFVTTHVREDLVKYERENFGVQQEDYMVPNLTRYEWPQKLRSLTADSMLWYARKLNNGDLIFSCRDFLNVPLIGSRVCINYNPTLAL